MISKKGILEFIKTKYSGYEKELVDAIESGSFDLPGAEYNRALDDVGRDLDDLYGWGEMGDRTVNIIKDKIESLRKPSSEEKPNNILIHWYRKAREQAIDNVLNLFEDYEAYITDPDKFEAIMTEINSLKSWPESWIKEEFSEPEHYRCAVCGDANIWDNNPEFREWVIGGAGNAYCPKCKPSKISSKADEVAEALKAKFGASETEEKNPTATQLIIRRLTNSECRDNEDLKDVVKTELELLEYDGLYSEDCGCSLDDFMPCTEFCPDKCRAGYKRLGISEYDGKPVWGIGPEKMEFSEADLVEHPSLRAIENPTATWKDIAGIIPRKPGEPRAEEIIRWQRDWGGMDHFFCRSSFNHAELFKSPSLRAIESPSEGEESGEI